MSFSVKSVTNEWSTRENKKSTLIWCLTYSSIFFFFICSVVVNSVCEQVLYQRNLWYTNRVNTTALCHGNAILGSPWDCKESVIVASFILCGSSFMLSTILAFCRLLLEIFIILYSSLVTLPSHTSQRAWKFMYL